MPVMVSMVSPVISVSEDEVIANVCVTANSAGSSVIQVNLTDIPGTAQGKIV